MEGPDSPATLHVQPSLLSLHVGGTAHLLVFGDFADGQKLELTHDSRIRYTIENPAIIKVGSQGMVTAVAPGSTKLTITYGQNKAQIPVTVSEARSPDGKR